MAEFVYVPIQLVDDGDSVLLNATSSRGCRKCIGHSEDGSGVITLRNYDRGCAQYRVSFGANIAVPAGGAVGPISIAISVRGETRASSEAIVTPTVVDAYFNVYTSLLVPVSSCESVDVAVVNTSDQPINIQNARLIVGREE